MPQTRTLCLSKIKQTACVLTKWYVQYKVLVVVMKLIFGRVFFISAYKPLTLQLMNITVTSVLQSFCILSTYFSKNYQKMSNCSQLFKNCWISISITLKFLFLALLVLLCFSIDAVSGRVVTCFLFILHGFVYRTVTQMLFLHY